MRIPRLKLEAESSMNGYSHLKHLVRSYEEVCNGFPKNPGSGDDGSLSR